MCLVDRQLADSEEMFVVCDKKNVGPKKRVTSLRVALKLQEENFIAKNRLSGQVLVIITPAMANTMIPDNAEVSI